MPFVPDNQSFTPDQKPSGFVPDGKYDPRLDPSVQDLQNKGKAAEGFLKLPFLSQVATSLHLGSGVNQSNVDKFIDPEEQKAIARKAVATSTYGAPAKFISSGGEAVTTPSLNGPAAKDRPTYKVPGLDPYQSFQTDAQKAIEGGAKPFGLNAFVKPSAEAVSAGLQTMGSAKALFGDFALTPRGEWSVKVPEWVAKGGKITFSPGYESGQYRPGLIPQLAEKGIKAAGDKIAQTKQDLGNYAQQNLKDNWESVFKQTKSGARTMAESDLYSKDPSEFLSNKQITISTDHGKIDTSPAIAKINEDLKPLNGVMDQILKSQPQQVPVDDFEQQVLDSVDNQFTRSQGVNLKMQDSVRQEFNTIKQNYGDTLTLDQINQIKVGQKVQSGVFDMTKPKFTTDVNYQISKTAKDLIEKNVQDVSIKELNSYIGDHYDALNMLDKVNGQVIKGGKLSRLIGSAVGFASGHTIPGKIVGGMTGNYVVGIMQDLSVSNPVKNMMLKYAQQNDPEIYQQAMQYLTQEQVAQSTRLALPAPGQGSARINLPEPGVLEGQNNIKQTETPEDLSSQIKTFTDNPSKIPLYRGESASNSGGLSYTNDPRWAQNFGKTSNPITIPKDANIKVISGEDVKNVADELLNTPSSADVWSKGNLGTGGLDFQKFMNQKLFGEGYDVIVQPDNMNPDKMEVIISPGLLEKIKMKGTEFTSPSFPELPSLKSIIPKLGSKKFDPNKLYSTLIRKLPETK